MKNMNKHCSVHKFSSSLLLLHCHKLIAFTLNTGYLARSFACAKKKIQNLNTRMNFKNASRGIRLANDEPFLPRQRSNVCRRSNFTKHAISQGV